MTKLRIDIRNGVVEVEADKELADKVYSDFKGVLLARMQQASNDQDSTLNDEPSATTDDGKKTKSRPKSSGGPSCATR
jgi:hypothetical protein